MRSKIEVPNRLLVCGSEAETTTPSTEQSAEFIRRRRASKRIAVRPPFAMLVAGRYEDEWAVIDGDWHWTDRFIVVQFKNDLDRHMHSGSQPYN